MGIEGRQTSKKEGLSLYIRDRYILCLPCCAQPVCRLWLASSGKVFSGQGCHPSPCCFQIPSLRECLLSLFLTSHPLRERSQGQDGQMSCYLPGSPRLSSILLFMMPRKPLGKVVCAPVIVPGLSSGWPVPLQPGSRSLRRVPGSY